MQHSSEDCFVKRSDQNSTEDIMGGTLGSRSNAVKQYEKYENKWKNFLKTHRKQNKILYSIAKKSVQHRELKNINNIRAKSSKKHYYSSSDCSINESYSDSSLSRYRDLDKERQTDKFRDINRLDNTVTDNIKTNKYQRNYAIENDPNCDSSFNLSSVTKEPLPVVTVSLQ